MVHVTVFRLRVGSFGSTSVTCSAEKIYSGGASDRITELIRDLPQYGSAIETGSTKWKADIILTNQAGKKTKTIYVGTRYSNKAQGEAACRAYFLHLSES